MDIIPHTTPRHDGWTPARQRAFLETLAATGVVRRACGAAGLSAEAAYLFRHRRAGAAFAHGWEAACLIARRRTADDLMERALEGQEDVLLRGDGEVRRRRIDNRLGMSLLSRLDRICAEEGGLGLPARIIAQDFEAYLDIIESGGTAAAAGLFIAARDEDVLADFRGAEHCQLRGPDAGDGQDEDSDPGDNPEDAATAFSVWWDADEEEWRTDFPPPEDYEPYDETGVFGEKGYARSLSDEECEAQQARHAERLAPVRAAAEAARRAWFGLDAPTPARRPRKAIKRKPAAQETVRVPAPEGTPVVADAAAPVETSDAVAPPESNPVIAALEAAWAADAGAEAGAEAAPEPVADAAEDPAVDPLNDGVNFVNGVRIYEPDTKIFTREYCEMSGLPRTIILPRRDIRADLWRDGYGMKF